MTIGEKIQKCRKDRKMSQEELAAKLGVSRQAVSKWELNESIPDTENVVQLGRIFDISLDYLLKSEIEVEELVKGEEKERKSKHLFYYFVWIIYFVLVIMIAILTFMKNMVGIGTLWILNISVLFGVGYLVYLVVKALKKYIRKC